MLRSFRVVNHKSFRDEAELLLIPAYDKSRSAVPVAGIFGANASGKSNLLDALRWLQAAVRGSYAQWEPGAGVPRAPFRLEPDVAAAPSIYCVEVLLDEGRYTYGVELDDEHVIEEWLYTYPHNRRRVIFEREHGKVRLGSTVPDHRARGEQLARQTRDNALLLSVAAHNDLAEVQPVYDWFRTGLASVQERHDSVAAGLIQRLTAPDRDAVVALVQAADLGIVDITVQAQLTLRPRNEVVERILAEVSKRAGEASTPPTLDSETTHSLVRELVDIGSHPRERGLVFHHGSHGQVLTLAEQSAGTRSWLNLVVSALRTLDDGALLVVDEVDASLHPHLTARLVRLFRDSDTNPHGAQLLFTTHDPTLLDDEVLARDEIWFVKKEPSSGATRLYPLTDFHPRKNEDVEGRYLAGGYGAIPILTDYRFRRAVAGERVDDVAA